MGQKNWALGCAVVIGLIAAAKVGGQQRPTDAIGADKENGRGSAELTAAESDREQSLAGRPLVSASEAERRIEKALDQMLKAPMEFTGTPLNQIAQQIASDYDLPIIFDTKALEAAAASPDAEVSINVSNVTLRSALDWMLRGTQDLTYVVDKEVLLITTKDEADKMLEVRVYRIDDLLAVKDEEAGAAGGSDSDSLVDIITSNVEKDSWADNKTGSGEIRSFLPGMLIVTQTRRVHDQIDQLLAAMRRTKEAIEATGSPHAATAQSRHVTRVLAVTDKSLTESDESRDAVRESIIHSVDWGTADYGDGSEADVFLKVLPSRVIVRHSPHVVRQVDRVLTTIETKPAGQGRRGGGGF